MRAIHGAAVEECIVRHDTAEYYHHLAHIRKFIYATIKCK